jgi:hypothetical protein
MNKDTSSFIHPQETQKVSDSGMTLLQYYAGKALQGCLADVYFNVDVDKAAEICFNYADSMIAEYNKRYGGKK